MKNGHQMNAVMFLHCEVVKRFMELTKELEHYHRRVFIHGLWSPFNTKSS